MKRWAALLAAALAAGGCRQPVVIDTSGAQFIPTPVALENLRTLLPTADVVGCRAPKAIHEQAEVKEWKVDAEAIEFRVSGQAPLRLVFSEISSTRLERLMNSWQVRVFTPAQPDPKKDHFYFTWWRSEESARRAIELIDALRVKR